MYLKQHCMRLLYFLSYVYWEFHEVVRFILACIGNLAFKGDQSRNVIWQWSHGTHLDINKHNDPVLDWV